MAEATTARIGTPQRTMLRDSLRARITDLILPRVHKQLKAADASLPRQGDFESMFKAYDKNRDGVLQFSELQMAVRQDLGLDSSAVKNRDLKLLFDALDSDGGGTVGVDEWVRFLKADVDEDALSYNKTHRGTSVYVRREDAAACRYLCHTTSTATCYSPPHFPGTRRRLSARASTTPPERKSSGRGSIVSAARGR